MIPNFVVQSGCPDTEEGFKDPKYLLEPELNAKLVHEYGAIGAGRDGNPQKISARCQFYIVQNKKGVHRLDGDYTIFGKVIKGMDIVDSIAHVPRDKKDEPLKKVTLDVNIIKVSDNQLKKWSFVIPKF